MPLFKLAILAWIEGDSSDSLLDHATMLLSRRLIDHIHVVRIVRSAGGPEDSTPGNLPPPWCEHRESGRLSIEAIAGDPLDVLFGETVSRKVDVALVGVGRARFGRRSLARRLAMTAPCSVWMIPDEAPAVVNHPLVPVDLSARSAEALSVATAMVSTLDGNRCWTLHVRFNPATTTFGEYDEQLLGDVHRAFEVFAARVDTHDVDLGVLFEEGPDVAKTILRVAAERRVDLLVMSTRGRSRAAAVLLGSETDQVMMLSPIPVLAVKAHGTRLRFLRAWLERRDRKREGPRFG